MDLVNEPLSQQGNKYEVFLSCEYGRKSFPTRLSSLLRKARGEDTEESFLSHLYSSLRKARISVVKSIEGSKISIIIFSKHYASSRRCLEELTKIMEFHKSHDQVVFPIFYGVDPFEVHNQESSFGQTFHRLIQRISPTNDEVLRWRRALNESGCMDGIIVPNCEHNNESEVIQNIVERVRYILQMNVPFLTYGRLVGASSQVLEVIRMLQKHESTDIVFIGIWGIGGIGKTTIARLIFHHIQHDFESTCFLSNVREAWESRKGQLDLQGKIISLTCEAPDMRIDSHDKKVLVVVDDVNHLEQLHALCPSREWFGEGSRIIIITRDLHLLEAFQVDDVYKVKLLRDHESFQLLNRIAIKEACPEREFMELSRRMFAYTEGLPLALKVLGSSLSGRSPMEWDSALMKLTTVLRPDIYKTLKLSFDTLDYNQKGIFINTALFHIGEDINDVIRELNGHGSNGNVDIRALEDRSLITIDKNNKLRMHNMLQHMGRQIIIEDSQNELPNRGHRYEVFLSFRGEDTRISFTSHLYSALQNVGIIVFKDDVELPMGNYIRTELLQAIRSSKISIIIFSREYAASKWCLEELSLIMELHKSNDQVVLPVFYYVDPSEVRHQSSSFGDAFNDLIQRISPPEYQISNWRTTLTEVGGIAGIVVVGSRDESEYVKAIVENVCDILDKKDLFVADHPVGVDNRVQEVIKMLQNHQPEDVVMVGIWGMGGMGKTTIAKAIYNEIGRNFECRSYLPKIRKVWDQRKGQLRLQNQLLSEICKNTKMKISCIESGKITLRNRLCHKKALVVLDDVDKLVQLNSLVGSRDWFKPGSIIIITTRNQRLLFQKDCHVYEMKNLDEGESIELFSWHAFKQESPEDGFVELSRDIVAYSGGLPLALEILGSYLSGRKVEEWKSVLEKLKKIPDNKIQKKLKISFDGLDDLEKDIFLDISCFFIGMNRNDVTHILNGCGFFADTGIKTLMDRSLVAIDKKNKLGMHDLLRDMGREIIREQSQKELGRRSRLWFHEDAQTVLLEHMGTEVIEGLFLKLSQIEKMHFRTEAFKMMKRLRLLHLEDVELKGDYEYISKDLRWLCWDGFPLKYIPSNFYQKKLVAIEFKYSKLRQVWKEPQLLGRLKILNLSHSHYLVQTPDFSKLSNLEKLILRNCPSLSKIHHSIELLDKLLLLDLEDCIGLQSLPRGIYRLKCLKTLILSGCVRIEKLEEDIEQMESLTTLIAPTIKKVPFSLVRLKSILYLSVCGHEGLSRHVIPSLVRSWMSPTILSKMLNSIRGRPSTILSSDARQQNLSLDNGLEIYDSLYSPNCMDTSRLEDCLGHCVIQIGKNAQVFSTLSERISQEFNLTKCSDHCVFPGDNYPYWLTFKFEGDSVEFEVPPVNECDHLKGMTICCAYTSSSDLGNKACESCISCIMIVNYTKKTTLVYTEDKLNFLEEAEEILSNLESDDEVEVKAVFESGFTVKKMAVYLIYNEFFYERMKPSTSGTKHKCEE